MLSPTDNLQVFFLMMIIIITTNNNNSINNILLLLGALPGLLHRPPRPSATQGGVGVETGESRAPPTGWRPNRGGSVDQEDYKIDLQNLASCSFLFLVKLIYS
jgi:hypothetical protein